MTNILGDFPDVYNNEYTYSNGNISLIKTYRMVDGNLQLDSTEQYVYQSGNVIERTRTSTIISPGTVYYTYDNLKNPFSGMNKYLQQILETENITGLNANNAITRSHYSSGNPDLITQTYTIEYNQNGYPTNIKKFSDTNTLMCDTTIEYR